MARTLKISKALVCAYEVLFDEGFEAFAAGLSISDNPYLKPSTDYLLWADGFNHARLEAQQSAKRA